MMTPFSDLPAWSFNPDWSSDITESLEWRTDVLAAQDGFEQRRSTRLSPRRFYEVTSVVDGGEKHYLDLAIRRFGGIEWAFPLWPDQLVIDGMTLGNTKVVCDPTGFEAEPGGYIYFRGADAFDYEIMQVRAVVADGILLIGSTSGPWGRGSVIYPCVRGELTEQPKIARATSDVGTATVKFRLIGQHDYAEDNLAELEYFNGHLVLSERPDFMQDVDIEYSRFMASIENDIGLPYRTDLALQGFNSQKLTWLLGGRAERLAFKRLLYALRGRAKPVWVPTHNGEITPTGPYTYSTLTWAIKPIGLAITGPQRGRQVIRVERTDGTIFYRLIKSVTRSGDHEVLKLDQAPTGATVNPRDVLRISFIEPMRQDADLIEIVHHADLEGAGTCTQVYRTLTPGAVSIVQAVSRTFGFITPSSDGPQTIDLASSIIPSHFTFCFGFQYESNPTPAEGWLPFQYNNAGFYDFGAFCWYFDGTDSSLNVAPGVGSTSDACLSVVEVQGVGHLPADAVQGYTTDVNYYGPSGNPPTANPIYGHNRRFEDEPPGGIQYGNIGSLQAVEDGQLAVIAFIGATAPQLDTRWRVLSRAHDHPSAHRHILVAARNLLAGEWPDYNISFGTETRWSGQLIVFNPGSDLFAPCFEGAGGEIAAIPYTPGPPPPAGTAPRTPPPPPPWMDTTTAPYAAWVAPNTHPVELLLSEGRPGQYIGLCYPGEVFGPLSFAVENVESISYDSGIAFTAPPVGVNARYDAATSSVIIEGTVWNVYGGSGQPSVWPFNIRITNPHDNTENYQYSHQRNSDREFIMVMTTRNEADHFPTWLTEVYSPQNTQWHAGDPPVDFQFDAVYATSYTVFAGTLPPGLTLSLSGRLTGTPILADAQIYSFTIRASNAISYYDRRFQFLAGQA